MKLYTVIDSLDNEKQNIERQHKEIQSYINHIDQETGNTVTKNVESRINESLEILKQVENKPQDKRENLTLRAVSLLECNVQDLENLSNEISGDKSRRTAIEIRNKAERMWRLTLLLTPSDPQFVAAIRWASAKGEKAELNILQQLQRVLQKGEGNLIYNSQEIQSLITLINRVEEKVKNRILPKEGFIYRVLCNKEELEHFLGKIIIVGNYPSFTDILASEETIADIKQFFQVKQILNGVSKVTDNQIVQFNTPVFQSLKRRLEETGAKIIQPLSRLEVVVSIPSEDIANQIKNFEEVVEVAPFVPKISVKPQFLQHLGQPVTKEAISTARLNAARNPDKSKSSNITLPGIFIANFFTSEDRDRAAENLDDQGIPIANKPGKTKLVLDLSSDSNAIESLKTIAEQIGLQSLGEKSIPKLLNCEARQVIGRGVVPSNPIPTLGLTGKGEIIAIADSGLDTGESETLHLDFRERVNWIKSYPIPPSLTSLVINPGDDDGASDIYTGHGTHVAGSALGSGEQAKALGLSSIPQGMAPEAKLVFQAIEQTTKWNQDGKFLWLINYQKTPPNSGLFGIPDDLAELFDDAYNQKARIHSNSWGRDELGIYDDRSLDLDKFVWEHKDFLILVAAGNQGKQSSSATKAVDQGSITSPGTAKNCLTVGASENKRNGEFSDTYGQCLPDKFPYAPFNSDGMVDSVDDIAAFSSRGPCKREDETNSHRKPDIIAPGTFILSTRSSQIASNDFSRGAYPPAKDYYMYDHGTSMATPLVAGCAALVRQYLREIHQPSIEQPSAALVKAILIHSAQYIEYRFAHPDSAPWADNEQGWGRVDLQQVLNPAEPTQVLFIDESDGLEEEEKREYKIEITDSTVNLRATLVYTDYPGEYLVNNLNLILRSPSGKDYLGNDFNETGEPDTVNNVEGVVIQSPEIGLWTVEIAAEAILSALMDDIEEYEKYQDYAVVISGGGLKAVG